MEIKDDPLNFENELEKEEQEAENLINLMEQIKYARDNNQGLTDEERRKNAETIMNKLANMMDLGDDDDVDDEDGGRDYGDFEEMI